MRLAIIGAGNVGRALGAAWLRSDHDIGYGVLDPAAAKYADLAPRVSIPAQAVEGAAAIVLATPWPATEAALRGLGNLAGRIVIDCTNPRAMRDGGLALSAGFETSGGELVASWALGAAVFKTLNQTGAENMARAHEFEVPPVMFVAGDDDVRKPVVLGLVRELGFEAVDAGPLRIARLLEPCAMLWIDQALARGAGTDFAFARVRRR